MGFDGGDLLRLAKKLVTGGAPILGDLVTGGAGGKVIGILSTIANCDNDPKEVAKALETKPELLVELKKYEIDHELDLKKLQLEEAKLHVLDIQSARQREIETTKATRKRDTNLIVMAWTTIVGFFGVLGAIIYLAVYVRSFNPTLMAVLNILLGALITNYNTVYGYFFGSSKGSVDKTDAMNTIIKNGNQK